MSYRWNDVYGVYRIFKALNVLWNATLYSPNSSSSETYTIKTKGLMHAIWTHCFRDTKLTVLQLWTHHEPPRWYKGVQIYWGVNIKIEHSRAGPWILQRKLWQYHHCLWPGAWRHQAMSSHDIVSLKLVYFYLSWERFPKKKRVFFDEWNKMELHFIFLIKSEGKSVIINQKTCFHLVQLFYV